PWTAHCAFCVADRRQRELGLAICLDPNRRPAGGWNPRSAVLQTPLDGLTTHSPAAMQYILALDQGTTSSRAIVFDQAGSIKALAQKEFLQIFPQPGWVEHDPNEIWSTQIGVATEAISHAAIRIEDIA